MSPCKPCKRGSAVYGDGSAAYTPDTPETWTHLLGMWTWIEVMQIIFGCELFFLVLLCSAANGRPAKRLMSDVFGSGVHVDLTWCGSLLLRCGEFFCRRQRIIIIRRDIHNC